ncbi:hypothetical protein [Paraburkholderia sp. Ac-20347]|uniref:hypothetical protein n=1 Tax=Paraburkholderia sp. Ac-20347 TaxID=2703892 RepID=UPI00197DCC42|nr:hypothetical protein [Paraburkholderia sp. Ac-20347]MBN3810608.1 hypothetical protein [Paraburkholderia sp. Ac-20347]
MNYGRLVGKAEAIIATGMPGLYRVLAFMGVQKLYSLSDLGRAASAFSIAQILAFFTAIGWASLILVRVPAARDREERVERFYELLRMGVVSLLVLGIGVVLWSRFSHSEISGTETIVIMIGWTIYQLTRHYFLALRKYRRVIFYDVVLLVATTAYVLISRRLGVSAGLPLGAALGTTGMFMLINIGLPRVFPKTKTMELKGIEFGFTNFLSGGVALSLVPIANFTDGARFAGVISLIASVSAISALVPRAISMYRLPELSRLASEGKSLKELSTQTAREIMLSCLGAFVVNALIVACIVFYEGALDRLWYTSICGVALCAQGCISMLGMANSSVLMVREASRASMTINAASCCLFVTALIGSYAVTESLNFYIVLIVCIIVTVFRNFLLRRQSASFLISPRAE